jgi:hypothetical protein
MGFDRIIRHKLPALISMMPTDRDLANRFRRKTLSLDSEAAVKARSKVLPGNRRG